MDTNKLKELAERATPGPWVVDAQQSGAIFNIESESGDLCIAMSQENPASTRLEMNEQRRVNAEFIAAANPQAILALLDEIDRLKAENEALRGALQAVVDDPTWRSNDNTLWPKIIKAMNQPGATSSP
ncbi:ead/Ea22-like family protein [Pseudomonas aeruginosa]|uniref:ead/Ea22-like family protein n=1 Tax=Pseudomonas aeruginosa TaxID=287 RepID=UPI0029CD5AFE|nr:ead/Ea22-like family protein [Pseudomonas aeruginosa]HEJ1718347.1 ead/Ea22-like family protein [Pseudomonas aeruginosa]HEJ5404724.1 ead/Ea22-like family protein [Pseudomonas aeruginosa]HEJ5820780.1 ead/Ea22-like family protein [Pseudomonas aeruginosa]